MRALLLIYLITLLIVKVSAHEATISGSCYEWDTNLPLSDVKILFTRIGENVTTCDTIITEFDGTYSLTYEVEFIGYYQKYDRIDIKPLDTETHWFHSDSYLNPSHSVIGWSIFGILISDSSAQVSGEVVPAVEGLTLLLTQQNDDKSITKDTVLTIDTNGEFTHTNNIRKYRHYNLKILSDKWVGNYVSNRYYPTSRSWSNQRLQTRFHFEIKPIDSSQIDSINPDTIPITETIIPTISGHVYIKDGDSISNVMVHYFNKAMLTDEKGFYSFEVTKPNIFQAEFSKEGYSFSNFPILDNISNDMTIDIRAAVDKQVLIRGNIIQSSSRGSIDSIMLIFSGSGGQCMTDNNGNFAHLVRMDWSGSITPYKNNCIFEPQIIELNNINSDTEILFTETNNTPIITNPIHIKKQTNFEIVIYNVFGQRIGKAKNIAMAKLLVNNATGLYIYRKIIKDKPIITQIISNGLYR